MRISDKSLLRRINEEAIYNVYMYLMDKDVHNPNESLFTSISRIKNIFNHSDKEQSAQNKRQLKIIENFINSNKQISQTKIVTSINSEKGLSACVFKKINGDISVVFKGSGSEEWLDNGKGLSGISERNTYKFYEKGGKQIHSITIAKDYATKQQVEALNWFEKISAEQNFKKTDNIIISGHSKGGNKAQFITLHSDIINECYSFSGQGFSPEAITVFKKRLRKDFALKAKIIRSISAENDYVNILGERAMPEENIYFFESAEGLHNIDAILNENGILNCMCERGKISEHIEKLSVKIMKLSPYIRQFATSGTMKIFQEYHKKHGQNMLTEDILTFFTDTVEPMIDYLSEKNRNS